MRHARVYSASRKKVIWPDCIVLEGLERARGLMLKKRVEKPLAIEFASSGRRRNALHSLFCPPFDAVFVNSGGMVVDVVENVGPNSLLVVPRAACVLAIEVPPGHSRKVRLGEKLVVQSPKVVG